MKITVTKSHDGSKAAFVEHWNGLGWVKGAGEVERLPYRLPALIDRVGMEGVVVVLEGERDCDTASEHGITATCNPFGATKWTDKLSTHLVGARVVIIPDNDEIGRQHAQQVQHSLLRVGAACVEILDLVSLLPQLPQKGDLSDFVELGGDVSALRHAIDQAVDRAEPVEHEVTVIDAPVLEWSTLPSPLQEILRSMNEERQRVALLVSLITVIGGVIPRVRTQYMGQFFSPSLYVFVVGPPGSGKGSVLPAEIIAQRIDRELRDAAANELERYNKALAQWKNSGKKDGDDPPVKPRPKMMLIPADATGPVLIRAICENDAVVLFDSEADTLQVALRAETGDASSALRKAWQGERVSQARVGGDLYVSTDHPHLSIVITGTPDQVPVLIKHVATGLTSQFAFIEFPEQRTFHNPFAQGLDHTRTAARAYSTSVRNLWRFVLDRGSEIGFLVELSAEQQLIFREHFEERFNDRIESADSATTLRSGIVTMRIAVVLTVVRQWADNNHLDPVMVVDDRDFAIALILGEYLRRGTDSFIARLTAKQSSIALPAAKRRSLEWYEGLPQTFTTQQAIESGQVMKIGRSTIYDLLKSERYFERVKHGEYRKKQLPKSRGP